MYECKCVHTVNTYIHTYVSIHVCICQVCTYIHDYTYVCLHICVVIKFIHLYVYIYIYIIYVYNMLMYSFVYLCSYMYACRKCAYTLVTCICLKHGNNATRDTVGQFGPCQLLVLGPNALLRM